MSDYLLEQMCKVPTVSGWQCWGQPPKTSAMVDAALPASDELHRACCLRARSECSNAALKRPRPDSPAANPPVAIPVLKKKVPFDNKSLRAAVKLYCKDANAAEAKHGPISEWDVSDSVIIGLSLGGVE